MIDQTILESQEIIHKVIADYKPYAIVGLFSGGGDSLLMLEICKQLNIKLDFVLHVHTGTGLPQTLDFVRDYCGAYGATYIEASAGKTYEEYVLRKGFFGKGNSAHEFSYHVLKGMVLKSALSQNIVKRKRNRKILLFNWVRIDESENRKANYGEEVISINGDRLNQIWVNVIHWWTDREKKEYLSGNSIKQNPVSLAIGRSGECMCGTMQGLADRIIASEYCPAWGKWLDDLERRVVQNGFPWKWGQDINKYHLMERDGQINMFSDFIPLMCVGCKRMDEKTFQSLKK